MTPWTGIAQGLWVGPLIRPFKGEFTYILAITPEPTPSDNGVRLRLLAPPANEDQIPEFLDQATGWVLRRWTPDTRLLIQAKPLAWAELVIGALFVQMGATADEAILSLQRVKSDALLDQRHVEQLRGREVRHG